MFILQAKPVLQERVNEKHQFQFVAHSAADNINFAEKMHRKYRLYNSQAGGNICVIQFILDKTLDLVCPHTSLTLYITPVVIL